MIETIKFNVGGQHHQVSRSLLGMYPNTMLFKLVSDRWYNESNCDSSEDTIPSKNYGKDGTSAMKKTNKKDVKCDAPTATTNSVKDETIFIDRDGQLFRHVLNYLRDGRVILPIAMDKNTFLHELSYYGIHVNDDDCANITVNTEANAHSVLQINGLIASLEKEESCIRFARLCIVQFKEKGSTGLSTTTHSSSRNGSSKGRGGHEFVFVVRSTDYGEGNKKKDESLYNSVEEVACGGADMKERCNVYLKKFGLQLNKIDAKDVYRQRAKFSVFLGVL